MSQPTPHQRVKPSVMNIKNQQQTAISLLMCYLLVCFCCVSLQPSYAEVATASAEASTPISTQNAAVATAQATQTGDKTLEDIVVLRKTVNNEALNNPAFNNNAINNDAIAGQPDLQKQGQQQQSQQSNVPSAQNQQPASTAPEKSVSQLVLNSPVVDEAGILSTADKQGIEKQLRQIYNQGLAQAAVVIVPTTGELDTFSYAMQVAEKWQLGNKDTDDGLLILVAVNDHDMYILTGYGMEGVIPDVVAKRIIRESITPLFKQGDYAGGLQAGIERIHKRLTTDPDILAKADAQAARQIQAQNSKPSPIAMLIIGFVFGTFISLILGRFLGSLVTAGGFFGLSLFLGFSLLATSLLSVILFVFLLARGTGGGVIPTGGGGFGGSSGGGFGGGGFGSGGFGGGGGGFGGGGAGGSW